MSRIKTDPELSQPISVTSLIESYLFDLPDHVHVERLGQHVWPAAILHDVRMQWGPRHGSLLHKASEEGRLLWVQALIERGAQPWQAAESDGLPPVGWAAQAQETACVLQLLRHPGTCPNPKELLATNLFHVMMAQTDPVGVMAWLRWWQAHGDPLCVPLFDRPDAQGRHPTHVLADHPMAADALFESLFDLGFAADARDSTGRTPKERFWALHPERAPQPAMTPVVIRTADTPRFRRRTVTS